MSQRSSNFFIFNPACEMAIANGEVSWQPTQKIRQFEHDLEYLPLLFAHKNDYLAVHTRPHKAFTNWLKRLNLDVCEYILRSAIDKEIDDRHLYPLYLHPWGWSPRMHHYLRKLKPHTSSAFQTSPVASWQPFHKDFYSRKTGLKVLQKIVRYTPDTPLLPASHHPVFAQSIDDVNQCFTQWPQLVLKSPWSASGRGIQILRYGYLNESNRQWIGSILKQQGYLMVEPLLDKVADFSLHFHISPQTITFEGTGMFETNNNGQYTGNLLNADPGQIININYIENLKAGLKETFKKLGIQQQYEGYAGVDLMVVKQNDQYLIHPCVEINWRYNMGIAALKIEKFIHPDAKGVFRIYFDAKHHFANFHHDMEKKYPLKNSNGLIYQGYFPLSDPVRSKSGAYVVITNKKVR